MVHRAAWPDYRHPGHPGSAWSDLNHPPRLPRRKRLKPRVSGAARRPGANSMGLTDPEISPHAPYTKVAIIPDDGVAHDDRSGPTNDFKQRRESEFSHNGFLEVRL